MKKKLKKRKAAKKTPKVTLESLKAQLDDLLGNHAQYANLISEIERLRAKIQEMEHGAKWEVPGLWIEIERTANLELRQRIFQITHPTECPPSNPPSEAQETRA